MANKVNRLTLKVGIVFDNKALEAESKRAQKLLDKKSKEMYESQKKYIDSATKGQKTVNKGTKEQISLLGKLKNVITEGSKKYLKFFIVAQMFLAIRTQIKNTISLMYELDTAFTNFSIVSNATASEVEQVNQRTKVLSKELGVLRQEVINTVTEFKRAGFTIDESLSLAENAIMGANVGMTELSNVTTFLIAGLKAFNLEASESGRILDVLLKVANTTAIDLEGIGEAFLRSANTLATAGATLEQASALIAGANESIQDPAKVGTALKTIASRLRGVSEAGETIPKLKETFDAVGVSIQNADGSFRNIYDVFKDLSQILPTLDDLTKESLLEKLAGKRQKNIVIGLLNNFDTAEQALKDALNSTGEVARANEKYLDSLAGRTKVAKEQWNQLLQSFLNTDGVKVVVSTFGQLANLLNIIIIKAPILISALGAITVAVVGLGSSFSWIPIVISGLGAVAQVFKFTQSGAESLSEKLQKTNDEISRLKNEIGELNKLGTNTEEQERYIKSLERTLALQEQIRKETEKEIANKELTKRTLQLGELAEKYEDAIYLGNLFNESGEIADSKDAEKRARNIEKVSLAMEEQKLKIEESIAILDKNSNEYEKYNSLLLKLNFSLDKLDDTYKIITGTSLSDLLNLSNDINNVVEEQISLFEHVKSITLESSNDYQLLSDALEQLELEGYLTDDMLQKLIETYPDVVNATGLAKDAFTEFTESNKANRLEEIKGLRLESEEILKNAEIKIQALKAVASAGGQRYSLVEAFKQAELAIENAKTNLALLKNEEDQLNAVDKARIDSIKSSKKQYEALSELELQLKRVNFEIDVQQKLLGRTEDAEEQIKISEKLIKLYADERNLLIKQQDELMKNSVNIKRNTEDYDKFIDESYKLSIAIEDSTNNIYNLSKSINDLNDEISKNEIEKLRDKLSSLIDTSSSNLLDSAKKEAETIKNKLDTLRDEYDLRKKNLEISRQELDHANKMAEFNEEISAKEIESEMLQLDNSLESQRRRAVLADELASLRKDKQDEIDEYGRVLEDRRIDDEYNAEKKSLEERLKLQEDFIDDLSDSTSRAMEMIGDNIATSTSEIQFLIEIFSKNVGEALEQNIGGTFDNLSENAMNFMNIISGVASGDIGDISGVDSAEKNSVIAQMKANSEKWFSATEEERSRLNAENRELAKSIGYKYDNAGFYIPDWLSSNASYEEKQKYRLYDNGGKLEKGQIAINKEQNSEWVLTDKSLMAIFEKGLQNSFIVSEFDSRIKDLLDSENKIDKMINIENMNNNVYGDTDVERMGENMAKGTKNKLSSYGYRF